jgi:hypothetical protein
VKTRRTRHLRAIAHEACDADNLMLLTFADDGSVVDEYVTGDTRAVH